eukprot:458224_1
MAVGAYNNTIYLLGGNNDRKQLIQYDITTATLIDNGTLALPADVYVISQGYTQIDNILYIIAGSAGGGKSFKILDMKTSKMTIGYQHNKINLRFAGPISATKKK